MINKTEFNKLLRFDSIRFLKLLEILQNSVLGFMLGLVFGGMIDKYSFDLDKNKSTSQILFEVILQVTLFTIGSYYIKKMVNSINFCCGFFNKKYKPSLHLESSTGITIGLAYVFSATQFKLHKKIKYLIEQYIKK